jgi:hypothetical protein
MPKLTLGVQYLLNAADKASAISFILGHVADVGASSLALAVRQILTIRFRSSKPV